MAAPSLQTQSPRVISLVRVSTNRQDVARQLSDVDKAKRKFGLDVARVVKLVGVSGIKTFDHAEIKAIIAQIENDPTIDGIQISALDRLFRPGNSFKPWQILEPFLQCHKKIWTNADGLIDLDTDEGMDKATAIGHAAGVEWRRLKQRSADGRAEVMDLGRLPGGTPRYGYDYVRYADDDGGGYWVINEAEAAIVREIFAMRLAGMQTYAIAADLNRRGILSKGHNGQPPKPWSRTTVLQALKAREYIGEHRYSGRIFEVPRIVTNEQFFLVQATMEEMGKRWAGRPGDKFLLRNFIFCAKCRNRMVGHTKKAVYGQSSYRCGHKTNKPPIKRLCAAPQVKQVRLEEAVWKIIWRVLTTPALLLSLGRAYYDAQAAPDLNGQDEQRSELETLKRALANKKQMCDEGFADFATEGPKMRELRNKISFIEAELAKLCPVVQMPAEHEVASYLREIANPENEPVSTADRRDILEGLEQLEVYYADGEVEISGKVPMGPLAGGLNCDSGLDGTSNTTPCIPFYLKERVA